MQETDTKLIWKWNKKPILLENLDEKQLYSIKRSIQSSENKTWFGQHSDVWLKNINMILNDKTNMINSINKRRTQKACKNADLITRGILKCFK